MPRNTPSRADRRRRETERRIVDAAARLFAARGVDGASLVEVAEAADVARGTLYNHFRRKEDLIAAIVRPVFRRSAEEVEALEGATPRAGVEGVVRIHLTLWREMQDAVRVTHQLEGELAPELLALHRRYLRQVLARFEAAAEARVLRTERGDASAFALRRVAIPLLESFSKEPEPERLYFESVCALLLVD